MFLIIFLCASLLIAFNPCQLAINMSALTFLHDRSAATSDFVRKGIAYVLGRSTTYVLLILLCSSLHLFPDSQDWLWRLMSGGELLLPFMLIAVGAFLLYRTFHHHEHHGDECHSCGKTIKRSSPLGSFILGITLAFALCPETVIMFCTMIVAPASSASALTWFLPFLFAIIAASPVLILTCVIAKASTHVQSFVLRFKHLQRYVNAVMAAAFIIAGIVLWIAG